MKEDIIFPKVEKVGICAVPDQSDETLNWKVHLINLLSEPIENIIVSSKGYGKKKEEQVKTSELRHYFEAIAPRDSIGIEVITGELLGLSNQYWVSFYVGKTIYDKKFIFLPETLIEENLVQIPVLDVPGILII